MDRPGARLPTLALVAVFLASMAAGDARSMPRHVLTADYLGGYAGTHKVPFAAAAPYLSWAEIDVKDANAISALGIKTIDYTDPNRVAQGDPLYLRDESAYAHTCEGARISRDYRAGVKQQLLDPASPRLQSAYRAYLRGQAGSGHFDAFFYDDANNLYGMNGKPCNFSEHAWLAATMRQIAGLGFPIIYSNLDAPGMTALNADRNVLGGLLEECYTRSSEPTAPYTSGELWMEHENIELHMAHDRKLLFCYNNDTEQASGAEGPRLYTLASFLLTYDPATSVLWEYFQSPSGFHVLPESGFVALDPLRAAPHDIGELRRAGGAFGREYAACYLRGAPLGACAVAVNPDPSRTAPFPFAGYRRSLRVEGGSIADGGQAQISAAALARSLAPLRAVIAVR